MESKRAEIIFARLSARYSGRIDAELELGDRILVIFHDGAAILHSLGDGVKPKNWMPSGSEWIWEQDELLVGEHIKRQERLEIYIETIFQRIGCEGQMHGKLVKLGSERELSDLLSQNIGVLGDNLTFIAREWRTRVGPIDLLCQDDQGNPIAIEVKRARISGAEVAYQLLRYLDALKEEDQWQGTTPKGILAAPGISRAAQEAADTLGMKYIRIRYEDFLNKQS